MDPRLTSNSLNSLFFCLQLLCSGMTGVYRLAQLGPSAGYEFKGKAYNVKERPRGITKTNHALPVAIVQKQRKWVFFLLKKKEI